MCSRYFASRSKEPGLRTPQVRYEARVYWWLRAALAPLVLLNMAFSGILQARRPSAYHDALPLESGLSDGKAWALPRLSPTLHPRPGPLGF